MKNAIFLLLVVLSTGILKAQNTISPKENNSIRIMSYNVHNGIGMDDETDYERIAGVINRVAPDLVAVQELDSAAQRSNGVYVLKEIAEHALMHYTYGAAIDFQGGKYGIGILSKEKPLNYHTVPLPGREESRLLLIAEFEDYVFCCTHFSLTEEDRNASVAIIQDAIKNIKKPLFLAGDMNSKPESITQESLREYFTTLNNPKAPTFPVVEPKECIDYIYGYNNGNSYSVLQRQVLTDEQVASDHLPLFVDVRLKKDVSEIFRTKPYLQNPTDNGITISWFTNVPVHSWVEFGKDQTLGERMELLVDGQVICNNTHHKFRLTGLKPGETYYYRVCSREITLYEAYNKDFGHTAYSGIYSLTMPPDVSTDFTAIILNDLHKNKTVIDLLTKQMDNISYDFVVFNGDCIDDPKNEAQAVEILSYMNEKVNAMETPIIFLRGNHEIRNAYSIELRNVLDYVGNKTYGAFNWGDTRFVLLDCGEDKPDSTWVYYGLNDFTQLRLDQVDFLKKELTSDDFRKAPRKVLIHHIPIYGMPENEYNPCLDLWGDLLKKAPFDIGINGHTHQYAYHPINTVGNAFPVVIGGGNKPESATMMILQKTGKDMTLTVLDAKGNTLKEVHL
ncbi:MAG: metallophosphoesterase [Tannerella sp.]|jgi:endonuclease/exonuclease/phosphatase family metal-dependent hydrolase/predicted phosphodiesterase|nr:metallophosphoesterase [Tannerella sp.]